MDFSLLQQVRALNRVATHVETILAKIVGFEMEECDCGEPDCREVRFPNSALPLVQEALDGKRKLYEVDEVNALKMTVEEGSEVYADTVNDLAMLLGVELKPCIPSCPGHLPGEALKFLSDLRKHKQAHEWPEKVWRVVLRSRLWRRFANDSEPPVQVVADDPEEQPLFEDSPRPFPRICPYCKVETPAGRAVVHRLDCIRPQPSAPAPAEPSPCPGTGKGLGWAQVEAGLCSCPVCGACNLKAVPMLTGMTMYRVPQHPPAAAVSDAVETRSEPEAGVVQGQGPEAPGEASTAPWKGIADEAHRRWIRGREVTIPNMLETCAKEAYEAGRGSYEAEAESYYERGFKAGHRAGAESERDEGERKAIAAQAAAFQPGYDAGWAAAMSSREAEKEIPCCHVPPHPDSDPNAVAHPITVGPPVFLDPADDRKFMSIVMKAAEDLGWFDPSSPNYRGFYLEQAAGERLSELGERYAQGVRDGKAEVDNTSDLYRFRPEFQVAIGKYRESGKTSYDLRVLLEGIIANAWDLGIAEEKSKNQESQIMESIAKDRTSQNDAIEAAVEVAMLYVGRSTPDTTRAAIREACKKAYRAGAGAGIGAITDVQERRWKKEEEERFKELIEKVRTGGVGIGTIVSNLYMDGRNDFAGELLDLLEGKRLNALTGGDSMT